MLIRQYNFVYLTKRPNNKIWLTLNNSFVLQMSTKLFVVIPNRFLSADVIYIYIYIYIYNFTPEAFKLLTRS